MKLIDQISKDRCYSAKEASEWLGLPVKSVEKFGRVGDLPRVKMGRRVLFQGRDLIEFIAQAKESRQR